MMRKKRTRKRKMMMTIKLSGNLELSCLQNNVNAFKIFKTCTEMCIIEYILRSCAVL